TTAIFTTEHMITIGVTGGIGSGKSEVCEIWQRQGAYVLNADDLAKQLMIEREDIRQEIIDTFGSSSYHDDGSLNRQHLAREAFEKGRVEELNAIVHPRMPGEVKMRMEDVRKQGYKVFVYEAALLLQNLRPGNLDYVVLVLAPEEDRIRRVQERDQVARDTVMGRMQTQQEFEQHTDEADFVIRNDGTLKDLEKEAMNIYRNITRG
ncbi:MAG: dephospho-CoA kinase, partial [Balneolaceae bacterium]|nr:dephospho-CoA kinase [Balneolaceae bacterium]